LEVQNDVPPIVSFRKKRTNETVRWKKWKKRHDTEHSKIRTIVEHTASRIKNLEQWIVSE
jgi:hypothetical protein